MNSNKLPPARNGTTTYLGIRIDHEYPNENDLHDVFVYKGSGDKGASLACALDTGTWQDDAETPISRKDHETLCKIMDAYEAAGLY